MSNADADRIRRYGTERYVFPARDRGARRFSIHVGEVHRGLGLRGRFPAVCSALKTIKFLNDNNLKLVETVGPESGQSSTVTYTYEFIEGHSTPSLVTGEGPWDRLRGALKEVFAELGGGEAYLRAERSNFQASEDRR